MFGGLSALDVMKSILASGVIVITALITMSLLTPDRSVNGHDASGNYTQSESDALLDLYGRRWQMQLVLVAEMAQVPVNWPDVFDILAEINNIDQSILEIENGEVHL